MKTMNLSLAGLILFASFVVSACGPGQILGPTVTPSPTVTITPTNTPAPTLTPTPTQTPTPTLTPTSTPTPLPGPKAGYWKGENKSGWPGNLSFQFDSSGNITDFRIGVPVFGNFNQVCEIQIDNIPVSLDGTFTAKAIETSTTALTIDGEFDSADGATNMKVTSVVGICENQVALLGIWYEAMWRTSP